ncbi:hypothetical protein O9X98_05335 [Agrobacterium salinitolerans]|nr:hypothetical protein [Agrobacterium salinitolerans]
MKTTRLMKGVDLSFDNLPLEPTTENIELAATFAFAMWKERWLEQKTDWESKVGSPYGTEEPSDLSGSCKFTSIFAALVFDADIDGNFDHQFAVKKGRIIDLNAGAADVVGMAKPYSLDPIFFGSRDHMASMKSCVPRIASWLRAFDESLEPSRTAALGKLNPALSAF